MLNGLDLFSGIGGISLALSQWVEPLAYCENDKYSQSVLLSRMHDGRIATAPIWDDITTLLPSLLPRNEIDIIYGGFPCQDISVAGNGVGLAGERSGLFFEVMRLVSELRPRFVFLENVPAITTRGLDRVCLEFTSIGYDCRWTIVSAEELGAPHVRERWFMLAHSNGKVWNIPNTARERCGEAWKFRSDEQKKWIAGGSEKIEHTTSERLERWSFTQDTWKAFGECFCSNGERWSSRVPKPTICRGDDGLRNRSHRLKGLGNAVVPLQAREAFMRLMGLK